MIYLEWPGRGDQGVGVPSWTRDHHDGHTLDAHHIDLVHDFPIGNLQLNQAHHDFPEKKPELTGVLSYGPAGPADSYHKSLWNAQNCVSLCGFPTSLQNRLHLSRFDSLSESQR